MDHVNWSSNLLSLSSILTKDLLVVRLGLSNTVLETAWQQPSQPPVVTREKCLFLDWFARGCWLLLAETAYKEGVSDFLNVRTSQAKLLAAVSEQICDDFLNVTLEDK